MITVTIPARVPVVVVVVWALVKVFGALIRWAQKMYDEQGVPK